jgi:aldose 1-epimerase
VPLIEPADLATLALKPTSYGIPLLAPTPGRIAGPDGSGRFVYRGASYEALFARHGFFRNRSWEVAESTPDSIACTLSVRPDSPNGDTLFPFELEARYDVELGTRGLLCRLTVVNTGSRIQPFAAGWHPYLHRTGACTVSIPAAKRWELNGDAEPVPTGALVAVSGRDDFRAPRLLAVDEHLDETLTDLPSGPVECWMEEVVPVLTSAGTAAQARVRRTVSFTTAATESGPLPMRHVQFFTPPSRNALCIEPFSAPPDALNLHARQVPHADLTELAPGQEAVYEMELGIEITLL